jgi:uncharacterized protein (TIGR00299 family) protein
MKQLHLEQVGGVSGDMLLGLLVDLGLDPVELERVLAGLGAPGLRLEVQRIESRGMPAVRARVLIGDRPAEEAPGPGHGHAHGHGHEHGHAHAHAHEHGHEHAHAHAHEHGHAHGPARGHTHRHYTEVVRLITGAALPEPVRDAALRVFRRLGEAEAFVHGTTLERVHFHEVGEWDSMADVVGVAWGLHRLGIERLTSGPFAFGRGEIEMAHGRWPVPAPATVRLCEGFPSRIVDLVGETVTPTGAALLTTLAGFPAELPPARLVKAGAGAGSRDWPDRPNVVRGFLSETMESSPTGDPRREEVALVEATIDDMTPQALAALAASLFGPGVLDVTLHPVQMKKGRPGVEVRVLAAAGEEERVARQLLTTSTTLGVRFRREHRLVLDRRILPLELPEGTVAVKFARRPGGGWTAAPEFEDCLEISHRTGKPLHYVVDRVRAAAMEALEAGRIDPGTA